LKAKNVGTPCANLPAINRIAKPQVKRQADAAGEKLHRSGDAGLNWRTRPLASEELEMKTIAKLGFQAALLAIVGFGLIQTAQAEGMAGDATSAAAERKTMPATCYERGTLLFDLAKDMGEKLSQAKRVGDNGLLEAFASPTQGTWTIVYSDSDKRSCVIASGDGLPIVQTDDEDARVPPRREAAI